MTVEEWRPVPGFPEYLVSSLGRVASTKRYRGTNFRYLTPQPHSVSGYPYVQMFPTGDRTVCRSVHGLVAAAFLGPRPVGQEVRHLDGDPSNPMLTNLRYGTHSENEQDKFRHGTALQTHCVNGHAFDEANTYVDLRVGRRYCRACTRVNSRRYRQRRAFRAANVPLAS